MNIRSIINLFYPSYELQLAYYNSLTNCDVLGVSIETKSKEGTLGVAETDLSGLFGLFQWDFLDCL